MAIEIDRIELESYLVRRKFKAGEWDKIGDGICYHAKHEDIVTEFDAFCDEYFTECADCPINNAKTREDIELGLETLKIKIV